MALRLCVGAWLVTQCACSDPLFTYRLPITNELRRALGYPPDTYLSFIQRALNNGFTAKAYEAVTRDGYIITMFNLWDPKCKTLKQPPILLVHGYLLSSDVWVDAGREAALGYLIAGKCYNLWLGNLRGNTYGRNHTTLDPDKDAKFWQFSIDQQGYYDIPAQIDLVLEETGSTVLNYIGYSQGGLTAAIALSEYPEYNDKVNIFIGLAPAIRMTNCRSIPFRLMAFTTQILQPLLKIVGIYELFAHNQVIQVFLEFICKKPGLPVRVFCIGFLAALDSYDPNSISESTRKIMYSHFPAGINVGQAVKYAQMFQRSDSPKYDYGPLVNLEKYGTVRAPNFPLEKITVPTVLVTGLNDKIVASEDVEYLRGRLPNVIEYYVIRDPNWDHFDVIFSKNIPQLLFPKVNEYLKRYSNNIR